MRTARDARRSLRKYIGDVLGDAWEVRDDDEQGMVTLPHARVRRTAPSTFQGSRHTTDVTASFALYCTPVPSGSSSDAYDEADRVEELLVQGFRVGVGRGAAARVPLWDFDHLTDADTSMVRGHADYMRIESFSINQLPDPDDPNRVDVVADLRVSWRRATAKPDHSKILTATSIERDP